MKRLLVALGVPVALILLVLVGLRLFAGRAIQAGVERGGESALGVPTHLNGAELAVVGGHLDLSGLSVDNPQGYPEEPVLSVGRLELRLPVRHLLDDTVEVPLLAIGDVDFRLDRAADGSTNVQTLLERLRGPGGNAKPSGKAKKGGAKPPSDEGAPSPSKRFLVRELRLERVRATLNLFPDQRDLGQVSVTLAPIVLRDLDSSGEGMELGEIAGAVLDSLLNASIEAGTSQLGPEVARQLEAVGESYRAELESELEERAGEARQELERKAHKALGDLGGLIDG